MDKEMPKAGQKIQKYLFNTLDTDRKAAGFQCVGQVC